MDPDQRESLRGQIMDLNEKVDQWAQQNTELKDEVDLLKREVTRSHSIIDEKQEEIGKLVADLQSVVESEVVLAEEAQVLEKSRNIFRDQNKTLRDQNKTLVELVDALALSLRHIAQEDV